MQTGNDLSSIETKLNEISSNMQTGNDLSSIETKLNEISSNMQNEDFLCNCNGESLIAMISDLKSDVETFNTQTIPSTSIINEKIEDVLTKLSEVSPNFNSNNNNSSFYSNFVNG